MPVRSTTEGGYSDARRSRRSARWIGTGVIATSVTVASMLPEQAETFVTQFTAPAPAAEPLDLVEAVRPAVTDALVGTADLFRKTNHAAVSARMLPFHTFLSQPSGPSTNRQTVSHIIPGQNLAIRTQFVGDLQNALYRPRAVPDLRLTRLPPPYTTSGPGNFEIRLAYVTGSVERSLFEAGQEAGLSDPLILKLVEIFGWDIDFALDVHPGDSFGVVYEQKYWLGRKLSDGPILAAEFSNRGIIYRAIGFRGPDGNIGYYTPTGQNLKRTFLRTPVKFSRVSSRFSKSRYHPILKLWRAHNGVDYAAPMGTPVRATADGRVISVGWNGGYGSTVVIEHGGAFSTLYAHLSKFSKKLRAGQRVEQGDVIGYIGKTGLASGPHLHYEFLVNGRHKNPLTFEFPGRNPIAPEAREDFLRLAHEWVARLELIGNRHWAAAESR